MYSEKSARGNLVDFLFSRWGTHSRFQAVGELLPTGKIIFRKKT